jgi:hypothetical protein
LPGISSRNCTGLKPGLRYFTVLPIRDVSDKFRIDLAELYVAMDRGERPIRRPRNEPMFHGIDPAIAQMRGIIRLITNMMFPEPSLPNRAFAFVFA